MESQAELGSSSEQLHGSVEGPRAVFVMSISVDCEADGLGFTVIIRRADTDSPSSKPEQCKQASGGCFTRALPHLPPPRRPLLSCALQGLLSAGKGSFKSRLLRPTPLVSFLFVCLFFYTKDVALHTNYFELAFLLYVSWGIFLL